MDAERFSRLVSCDTQQQNESRGLVTVITETATDTDQNLEQLPAGAGE